MADLCDTTLAPRLQGRKPQTASLTRRSFSAGIAAAATAIATGIQAIPTFDPARWSRDLHEYGGAFSWDDEAQAGHVFFPIFGKQSDADRATMCRLSRELEANKPVIQAFMALTA
jgi:hypothetical protein